MEIQLEDGQVKESMFEWSLLHVALALKANKCAVLILKNKNICIMPRADLSNMDLEPEDAPNMVDDVEFLLDFEIRPLRACIIKKDFATLAKLWRRPLVWDSCHFYKMIELFIQRKDHRSLDKLLSPKNHYVSHFYEPSALEAILQDNPEATPNIVSKIQSLIESYESTDLLALPIEEWDSILSCSTEWEPTVWNMKATQSTHASYAQTIAAIEEVADYYGINTNIQGSTITPLHFLFAKHIKDGDMESKLLEKIELIQPDVTSVRKLVLLAKEGNDPRQIEADSFLDGGVFLLWCLMNNRNKLLSHFLGEKMIQFWRFAQLKTLLWAIVNDNVSVNTEILTTLMRSSSMQSNYASLHPA